MKNYLSEEDIRALTPQQARILNYIVEYKSISPIEAFNFLGITKLATRISELKRLGYQFDQKLMTGRNHYGDKVHFMRYWFKKEA